MNSITSLCESIRQELDIRVEESDIPALQNKLERLSRLVGTSAESVSLAKGELLRAQLAAMIKYKDSNIKSNLLMKMIDAECSRQHELFVYCDRLNAGITHAIDALRTIISLKKREADAGQLGL